ncbi:MAG TPA: RNA-guided endonuclease IscB, partial [Desulfobaccales bacterium]
MQYVFVLDKNKQPLDPCHPARARQLLKEKRATVFRRYPFMILLKDRELEESVTYAHQVTFDPDSRTSGIALVREKDKKVLWVRELTHRELAIKGAMDSRRAIRHNRRSRKCRYRPPRFDNRRRREGWLPPSLESRVANFQTWARRLVWSATVEAISMEPVKFDTQALQNTEIPGVEYQQGELMGYEIREYLLEKWGRKCAYCDKTGVPLEVEHILPRSRGGSDGQPEALVLCPGYDQLSLPLVRALLEGVAFMLRQNLEFIERTGMEIKEIRSTGGGARSRLWNQIKADVCDRPVVTLVNEETGLLGDAVLAGVASGIFQSIEEGCRSMVAVKESIQPGSDAGAYAASYKMYC